MISNWWVPIMIQVCILQFTTPFYHKKHGHAIIHPKYVSKHMSPLDIDVYYCMLFISDVYRNISKPCVPFCWLYKCFSVPGCSGALRPGHTILRSPGLQPILLPGGTRAFPGTQGIFLGSPKKMPMKLGTSTLLCSPNFQPRFRNFLMDVAVGLSSYNIITWGYMCDRQNYCNI